MGLRKDRGKEDDIAKPDQTPTQKRRVGDAAILDGVGFSTPTSSQGVRRSIINGQSSNDPPAMDNPELSVLENERQETFEDQNDALKQRVAGLEQRIDTGTREFEQLRALALQYEQQIRDGNNGVQRLQAELKETRERAAAAQREAEEAQEAVAELKLEAQDLEAQNKEQAKELQKLRDEAVELRAAKLQAEEEKGDGAAAKQELERVTGALNALESEYNEAQKELEVARKDLNDMTKSDAFKDKLKKAEQKATERANEKWTKLKGQNDKLKKETADLKKEARKMGDELKTFGGWLGSFGVCVCVCVPCSRDMCRRHAGGAPDGEE